MKWLTGLPLLNLASTRAASETDNWCRQHIQWVNHVGHANFVASAARVPCESISKTAKTRDCTLTELDAKSVKTDGRGLMREMKCLNEVPRLWESDQEVIATGRGRSAGMG